MQVANSQLGMVGRSQFFNYK